MLFPVFFVILQQDVWWLFQNERNVSYQQKQQLQCPWSKARCMWRKSEWKITVASPVFYFPTLGSWLLSQNKNKMFILKQNFTYFTVKITNGVDTITHRFEKADSWFVYLEDCIGIGEYPCYSHYAERLARLKQVPIFKVLARPGRDSNLRNNDLPDMKRAL